MLASPGSYLPRLALYEMTMLVWNVISKTHEMLAHIGILVPHGGLQYDGGELRLGDEIDQTLITLGGTADDAFKEAMADALDPLGGFDRNPDLLVGHPVPDRWYPLYQVVEHDGNGSPVRDSDQKVKACEYLRPWAYPVQSPGPSGYFDTRSERIESLDRTPRLMWLEEPTVSGPFPAGTMPDDVLFGTQDIGDPDQRSAYENSQTPQATEALSLQYLARLDRHRTPLGAPVPFAAYLIGRVRNDGGYGTHFNLDSDRAYGYLTWDWIRTDDIQHEDLGFPFRSPATWPQLAAGWVFPPVALRLEYVDRGAPAPPASPLTDEEAGDHG